MIQSICGIRFELNWCHISSDTFIRRSNIPFTNHKHWWPLMLILPRNMLRHGCRILPAFRLMNCILPFSDGCFGIKSSTLDLRPNFLWLKNCEHTLTDPFSINPQQQLQRDTHGKLHCLTTANLSHSLNEVVIAPQVSWSQQTLGSTRLEYRFARKRPGPALPARCSMRTSSGLW